MFFWFLFTILILMFFGSYRITEYRHKPKYFNSIGLIFLILITIFRFDIGWDYEDYYRTVWPILDIAALARLEPGSIGIMTLSYYLGSPIYVFAIYGTLTIVLTYISLYKYSDNLFIGLIVYLTLFYLISLSIIRQGLAISIIMFSFHYIVEKKYLKYIIGCFIATLFHSSALIAVIFLPLYILSGKKSLIPLFLTIAVSAFSVYKVAVMFFFKGYEKYLENMGDFSGGSLIMLCMVVFMAVIFLWVKKYGDRVDYKMTLIPLLGCVIPFILGGHFGSRISLYFYIPLCFLIPRLLPKVKARKIGVYFITVCLLFFNINIFVDSRNPKKSQFTPYQTIWSANAHSHKFK